MEKYIEQLLADLASATENTSFPFTESEVNIQDWVTDEEENRTTPIRNLEDWTGIVTEQLPPANMLNESQINRLLNALKKMLDAYNCSFVLQTEVPELIQYTAIRDNFRQQVKVKRWHIGFFELCRPGTEHGACALGEYCQCAFYKELFEGFIDEDLSPEEKRARELEIEVRHLKRKYGSEWEKYYPYHFDINYDDKNGKPHDYGFNDEEDEEND